MKSFSILKEKLSEPTKLVGARDPYSLLLVYIFNQAVMDITAYYTGAGTSDARRAGRSAVKWIKNMEGTFPIIALAVSDIIPSLSPEGFHRMCLELIYDIEQNTRKKRADRIRVITHGKFNG